MWIYVPLVVIAGVSFVYWYLTKDVNYFKDRNIACPEPTLLFGNTKDLTLTKKFIGNLFADLYKQYPNEKIVGFFRMIRPCLVARDVDLIKNILIKDFDVFVDRGVEFDKDSLGGNLFSADPEMWRVLRTKFTPIFTSGKLKNMFPLIKERADKFMEDFEIQNQKQSEHDMLTAARAFTVSTISACAFGLDLDISDPQLEVLRRLDQAILKAKGSVEFLLMFPRILKWLSVIVFPREVTKFFHNLVRTVFTQRDGKPTNRKDFMDLILEMKQQKIIKGNKLYNDTEISLELNESIIAAQAFVFYFAGFETSSTTLSFLLYELSRNPDVQDKLLKEIDEVVQKCDGDITFDALMDMPYLSKVFDETLRKYPVLDPLQRRALVDYPIPGTKQVIKKGEIIFIPISGLHYDEKFYPNPEVFDPERFSPENSRDRPSCVYLPFGAGPRNCIGMRFAKVQSSMFLVKFLSKYRVESCENTPKNFRPDPVRVLLGPENVIKLDVIPRNKIIPTI